MYPFGNLPDNLMVFCDVLRREHGFRIGAAERHDAVRVLDVVDLADETAVRNALRPILSRTRDDAAAFDRAFSEFFFPGPPGQPQVGMPPLRRDRESQAAEGKESSVPTHPGAQVEEEETSLAAGVTAIPRDSADSERELALRVSRVSYSPLEAEAAGPGPELIPPDAAWRSAARLLVHRLHLGLSRRWRPATRGRRFDARRTLRASLQTGGEPLGARWLRRPRRAPRIVLLVDGSRSMEAYTATALHMAVAIASVTMRVDVFTFSTSLRRVTEEVRRAAAGERRRLEHLQYAWGGGTSIGASLHEFVQRFGERSLKRDTVVIVVSDGLDVGDPEVLRDAIRAIHRRSAALVWLNPLLATPGYEPSAAGMMAALPFVTTFTSVQDPGSLLRLSRLVHTRP